MEQTRLSSSLRPTATSSRQSLNKFLKKTGSIGQQFPKDWDWYGDSLSLGGADSVRNSHLESCEWRGWVAALHMFLKISSDKLIEPWFSGESGGRDMTSSF